MDPIGEMLKAHGETAFRSGVAAMRSEVHSQLMDVVLALATDVRSGDLTGMERGALVTDLLDRVETALSEADGCVERHYRAGGR